MGYDETIFHKDQNIAVSELGPHIRELRFSEFMIDYSQSYFPNTPDKTCDNFAVVWYVDKFDDIVIHQIYDHDNGIIYWEDNDEWNEKDETLVNSLLMYGNLEQIIA